MANAKNVKLKKRKSQAEKNNTCHDCGCLIKFKGDQIENGHHLVYQVDGNKIGILKCKKCYQKNPALTNFRSCEVYSRVVGYLRPVQQWNDGKQLEYKKRKEYKIKKLNKDNKKNCPCGCDQVCREF